ncbi:ABC transporter substrate binding protein [Desulfobacter vibrioformis]|uniref:ABC transporter substrate binding protein n=1 Tax=Desulfobacter vibrioformis TaxID=34031 RepID=UPI00068EBC06|nr:ABC transporter substrate binding protein [Desulfobacter vibrioformis]
MNPSRYAGLFLPILLIFCLAMPVTGNTAQRLGAKKHHVLLLNSYAKGYAWTDNVVRGVEDTLGTRQDVVLKVDYMDTKVNNTEFYYRLLKMLFAVKYSGKNLDVIISSDDDALKFLMQYRDTLFPGVPVVFCGANNFTPAKVKGFSNFTGVNEQADFATTLALMFKLHPKTRTVYVINDQMTTAGLLKKEFMEAAGVYQEFIDFPMIDNIDMAGLVQKVSRLPQDSLVFYLSFFKDNTGASFTPMEVIPLLAKASPVPIYGTVDYMLGLGIVGGMLKSSYYQGEIAGKLALEVLAGTPVSDIPVVLKSPNQYMFDYTQLVVRGISPRDLPQGSIIINEPETFYYKYKRLIWTITAVVLGLIGFIVILLFNIKKRIRAQKGLQTIINATSSIVDYNSLENFRQELATQLTQLLPVSRDMLLFNHGEPEDDQVDIRFPSPASNVDESLFKEMPETAAQIILDALKQEKCTIQRKSGVAFFKSRHLPGNLILLKGKRGMDDLDRDLLEIFASNLAMSIDNIEKHKIEKSLETARQIQMSMLPKHFSSFSEKNQVDLHAFLAAAKEVGGDLYDFFNVDEDHLCFVVGDVSDKGVPAALFMAMAKSLIRSAAENNTHPDQIIAKANNGLSRDNEQSMFVTVFLGIFKRSTRELAYTSAGHNPPYIVSPTGTVTQVKPTPGLVLGGFEGMPYTSETLTLEPGDGLFVYSDGITEAMNRNQEQYGEARLEAALARMPDSSAQALNAHVLDDLNAFVDGASQSDDITMLFVRV